MPLFEDAIDTEAIARRVEQALGATRLHPWENLSEGLRSQLAGAIAPADRPPLAGVVYPQTQAELAETLALAQAEGWAILPFGSGSKLGWGGLGQPIQLGVSTARLNRLVEHAAGDLTVTAEAGATVAALTPQLQQHRQRFGFNPAYPQQATLGGVVATADTGWMRQRYGGLRDMLIGVSMVRADGQRAKAGGRVVKNVAGYDLMKLMTGSWGSLGVVSEVTFRIYPQTEASKTLAIAGEAEALDRLLTQILQSGLTPTGLSLVNSSALAQIGYGAAEHPGVLVRFQSVTVGVESQADTLLRWAKDLGLTAAIAVDEGEEQLWERLQTLRERPGPDVSGSWVTAKVGLMPAKAIATVLQLEAMAQGAVTVTHLSSGLGWIGLDLQTAAELNGIRELYQSQGGFLSVMAAPTDWKQHLDIWGYSGNALPLMARIKQQFDPDQRLSPGRFLL